MDKKEAGRAPQYASRLALVLAFALGTAGCHGTPQLQFKDELIVRTDKFFDVAHVSGDTFVTVGYNGRILRTEDAGRTWKEVESPTDYSLNQVTFVDDYGWAVGHRGEIIHSRDGGKTWAKQQADTDKTIFSVSFVDKLRGWGCGDESTLVWTDNGGETWHAQRIEVSQVGLSEETSLAVPDIIYYSIQFVDQQHGWMVGEYGNIRYTSDGGKTWDSQHGSLLDALAEQGGNRDVMTLGAWFRVHFTDVNNGILVGAGGAVAVTDNGGQQWRWVSREGQKPDVPNLHVYDIDFPGQNGRLVAIGTNGLVLTSANSGRDWQPAKVPDGVFTWLNGIDFGDNGKGVLVGGKGIILLTDDGGQSWRTMTQTEEKG
ncbi:MAG: YCF48-related protein [Thermodesulfobacteriota bacterium]|jgi:photosystem II stability/assembly factor-like uncharacterized protein